MKVLLSLAVLLLFATQLSAGPILKPDGSKHIDILYGQSFLKGPLNTQAPAVTYESKFQPHCNWVSVTGESCTGPALFTSTAPVSATPEPAPLLLFGTAILGAFVLTRFRS
jgi:hypothetical protein